MPQAQGESEAPEAPPAGLLLTLQGQGRLSCSWPWETRAWRGASTLWRGGRWEKCVGENRVCYKQDIRRTDSVLISTLI